jgi:hypothetical protein
VKQDEAFEKLNNGNFDFYSFSIQKSIILKLINDAADRNKEELFMNYKEYRQAQIELQLAWREKQKNISKEFGYQNGNKYPHIVPKTEWIKTIWDQLQEDLIIYLEKEGIQRHTGSHNLLSSWVFCSNLYFAAIMNDSFRELFRQFLEMKLAIIIEKIDEIQLEFVLGGKLNPKILLGEPGGKKGTRQTTPDLAVVFTTNGKKGFILVESKYTEHSFYDCSGRKADKERGERCFKKETMKLFKEDCLLDEWGRKYWDYLKVSEYGLEILRNCPACIGGFQLVRQQALAEGIAEIGNYENVWSCIAFDGRNERLMKSMQRAGIDSIKNKWGKLFDSRSKFSLWEHQEWVVYVRENSKEAFENDWVNYINDRYNM